ncbi:hypothetical protein AB4508_13550 [Vibrio splendidus]
MSKCSRSTCFAPDVTCDLGCLDHTKCGAWGEADEGEASQREDPTHEIILPWSGSALGLVDLGFISGCSKPLIVGICGAQNAGKTTLLAAWYLLLGRGLICESRQFSGSYSLAGWEAVAGELRWAPGHTPSFPPHTSSRGGRAPGLLHMAFQSKSGMSQDYMFADAPGEWFQKWAVNRDSEDGAGAQWVSQHSDIFILIADSEALAGSNKGSARGSFLRLVHRLAAERRNRPVALVWTKSDVEVSPAMEKVIRDAVFDSIPGSIEFCVSVESGSDDKGQGLIELLGWVLNTKSEYALLPPVDSINSDPLFLFGTR